MSTKPIQEREEAPTDRSTDAVLLLASCDGATYATVRDSLEALDLDPFPFDVERVGDPVPANLPPEAQPPEREPFASFSLLDSVGYLESFDAGVDEPLELTETGLDAVDALRAGLDQEQLEAIVEATRP